MTGFDLTAKGAADFFAISASSLHALRLYAPAWRGTHLRREAGSLFGGVLNTAKTISVILDTNVFVAAGFNRRSHAARIIEAVRAGRLRMVWNEATRRETERILRQIPRLKWARFADLFLDDGRFDGPTHPTQFAVVPDPEDRKFAALAAATGAVLVTNDEDLLGVRESIDAEILTPRAFCEQHSI